MQLKWGIISTGQISQDFAAALQVLPKSEHVIRAVAARSVDDAKKFAEKYGVEKAYAAYEDVGKDADVNIVYIGTVIVHHYRIAKMLIENGKSVLCEKPLCINVKQTAALIELARKKGVFLMEGMWARFFPAEVQLKKELDAKTVGEVKNVIVTFGIKNSHLDRVSDKSLGGGTTIDMGVYCIYLASLAFGGDVPVKVTTVGQLNKSGVDESSSTSILYSGGRSATIIVSSTVELPCEGLIFGTEGSMKVPFRVWCPTALETPGKRYDFPLPETDQTFNYWNSVGLSYEAQHVRECLIKGLKESPVVPLDESLVVANIMESIRKQVGVEYPADLESV